MRQAETEGSRLSRHWSPSRRRVQRHVQLLCARKGHGSRWNDRVQVDIRAPDTSCAADGAIWAARCSVHLNVRHVYSWFFRAASHCLWLWLHRFGRQVWRLWCGLCLLRCKLSEACIAARSHSPHNRWWCRSSPLVIGSDVDASRASRPFTSITRHWRWDLCHRCAGMRTSIWAGTSKTVPLTEFANSLHVVLEGVVAKRDHELCSNSANERLTLVKGPCPILVSCTFWVLNRVDHTLGFTSRAASSALPFLHDVLHPTIFRKDLGDPSLSLEGNIGWSSVWAEDDVSWCRECHDSASTSGRIFFCLVHTRLDVCAAVVILMCSSFAGSSSKKHFSWPTVTCGLFEKARSLYLCSTVHLSLPQQFRASCASQRFSFSPMSCISERIRNDLTGSRVPCSVVFEETSWGSHHNQTIGNIATARWATEVHVDTLQPMRPPQAQFCVSWRLHTFYRLFPQNSARSYQTMVRFSKGETSCKPPRAGNSLMSDASTTDVFLTRVERSILNWWTLPALRAWMREQLYLVQEVLVTS